MNENKPTRQLTIGDILNAFVYPEDDKPNWVRWGDFCGEMNLPEWDYDSDKFGSKVKEFYIVSWFCTDTIVGYSVITLDKEIIAVTSQSGRKGDKQVEYVSIEAFHKLRAFMQTCLSEQSPEFTPAILNKEEEFPENFASYCGYRIEFALQVLGSIAIYKGVQCEIIEKPRGYETTEDIKIIHLSEIKTVKANECWFPFKYLKPL